MLSPLGKHVLITENKPYNASAHMDHLTRVQTIDLLTYLELSEHMK